MADVLTCRSAAKINLTLDVVSLRPDGYHELRSVVHTVALWDELTLEFGAGNGFSLTCNLAELVLENNLCLRAARAFSEAASERGEPALDSLRIGLLKTIPSGAGLGGGSGNAAAMLLALNRYYRELFDMDALIAMAARLGADVPLFLRGGCQLMEGIGERICPLPALDGWLVIVKPEDHVATPEIFRQWDEMGLVSGHGTDELLAKLGTGQSNIAEVANALQNDLQQVVEMRGIAAGELVARLKQCGAHEAVMTGSGSAVYGAFADRSSAQSAAARLGDVLCKPHWIRAAQLCAHGVEFG